jgi:hypothetical protein
MKVLPIGLTPLAAKDLFPPSAYPTAHRTLPLAFSAQTWPFSPDASPRQRQVTLYRRDL